MLSKMVDGIEARMLELPQAECPVVHHFGPGIYIREVTLPAGAVAIGHAQRYNHLNIMLTGAVAILDDEGNVKTLRAPMIFEGKPGRKVGYVLETCTWQNVYATEERDIDILEATYLDKSPTWQAFDAASKLAAIESHAADREDFAKLIHDAGFTAEVVREQSENSEDQIAMPSGHGGKITIRQSPIEGHGVFLSSPAEEGELLAPARLDGKRTPVGRYTNHSSTPNAYFQIDEIGDIYLFSSRRISGAVGGSMGEEVTVDYRQALALSNAKITLGTLS